VADGDATRFLTEAQRSLEAQRFEDAREAIVEAQAQFPDNDQVRDLYQQIHLADGVRRHRLARDQRRDEIRALGKKDRSTYRNSPAVTEAFRGSIASLDLVLAVEPGHAKAMMLKAGILDRMDRAGTRDAVRDLLENALSLYPENAELHFAQSRLSAPCRHCDDKGLCPDCGGAGEVSALVARRTCPTCKGHGDCRRCGLF
jgi:Zn finger protein HypA/HybF involved in hydrogenase expression